MKDKLFVKSFSILAWLAAGTAVASADCTDSPENPTVVLGLLGAASAAVPWLRARWQSRRRDASPSNEQGA
jgi:XrtJ-associated TM-motif-TM protein